jgi:chromosome segregation ATPase
MKSLKNDVKRQSDEYEVQIEEMKQTIKNLTRDKGALETDQRAKASQIKDLQNEIETFHIQTITTNRNLTQMHEIEGENERLRRSTKALTKQIHRLETVAKELQKEREVIQHIEDEFSALCDQIGIDPCEIRSEWTPIHNKIEEFLGLSHSLEELKARNESLEKRISSLLNDSQHSPVQKDTKSADDESFETLLRRVKHLCEATEKQALRIAHRQFEHSFPARIGELYIAVVKQVKALHSAVCGCSAESMRPLILCVIFARRLSSSVGQQTRNNVDVLSVFGGRLLYAPEAHISGIRSMVQSLTEDLLTSKTIIADLQQKIRGSKEEKQARETELQTNAQLGELNHSQNKAVKVGWLSCKQNVLLVFLQNCMKKSVSQHKIKSHKSIHSRNRFKPLKSNFAINP